MEAIPPHSGHSLEGYAHSNARDFILIRKRSTTMPAGRSLTFWAQWVAAISVLILLLCALAVMKTGEVDTQYRMLAAFMLLGSVPAYSMMQVYHKQHGYLAGLGRLLAGWLANRCSGYREARGPPNHSSGSNQRGCPAQSS